MSGSRPRVPAPGSRRRLAAFFFMVSAGVASGCAEAPPDATVVASVAPLGRVVESVDRGISTVAIALPAGASPETYDPSARRLEPLRAARLVVQVGDPGMLFEERMLRVVAAEVGRVSLAEVAAAIDFPRGEDPHLWLAPPILAASGERIAEQLGGLDPSRRGELLANAAGWREEVTATDREVRGILAASPCRTFLVDHPSWGSYAAHYGLTQLALEEHGKEPGPATLRRTLQAARQAGLRQVIALPGARRAAVTAAARQLQAEVAVIDPLAADVLDTLRRMATLVADSCTLPPETQA